MGLPMGKQCRYGDTLNSYISRLESLVCQLFYRCVLIISPFSHRTGLPQSTQLVSDRGGHFSSSFLLQSTEVFPRYQTAS